MKYFCFFLLICIPLYINAQPPALQITQEYGGADSVKARVYKVTRLTKRITIDGNWKKAAWKKIKAVKIENYMGKVSPFKPIVESKMMYDDSNVYVIFRVKDRFIRSLVQEYNGNVSGDSCVEFFFSPDSNNPLHYFNLEVNAGGTPLIFYVADSIKNHIKLKPDEIKQIEIAHSLPNKVDPEITTPVTWTIEYRVPFAILEKYSHITPPSSSVTWKANFYKTGSKTSNPNYITWSPVNFPRPNFHLPQFFGTLQFQ